MPSSRDLSTLAPLPALRRPCAAVVVLGCRVLASSLPSVALDRRIDRARDLAEESPEAIVVVSGGRRWGAHVEALCMARELERRGVAKDRIALDLWSLSTYENAVFSAAILKARGIDAATIVTCPWHLPRALESFRAVGIDATGAAADDAPISSTRRAVRAIKERLRSAFDARALARAGVLRARARDFLCDERATA